MGAARRGRGPAIAGLPEEGPDLWRDPRNFVQAAQMTAVGIDLGPLRVCSLRPQFIGRTTGIGREHVPVGGNRNEERRGAARTGRRFPRRRIEPLRIGTFSYCSRAAPGSAAMKCVTLGAPPTWN